jgi:hypothetical protein
MQISCAKYPPIAMLITHFSHTKYPPLAMLIMEDRLCAVLIIQD